MLKIKLAGIAVGISNKFPDLKYLCAGYETDETPKITLSVSQDEIELERSMQPGDFTDGYLETVCIYRKLALELLQYGVFLMHASVIELDGEGYAFLAPSGTGKTTQTRLWLEHFGDRARVINGDKPLIRFVPHGSSPGFIAYGTPWCGKENMGCKASVPLKALFLLERAKEPACFPASQEYSIDKIFRQMLLPEAPEQMNALLDMADRLIETLPIYVLRCDISDASVVAAYKAASES